MSPVCVERLPLIASGVDAVRSGSRKYGEVRLSSSLAVEAIDRASYNALPTNCLP